jgi:hypothetical protein
MEQKIRTAQDVIARQLGSETVLLNLKNEQYYSLDEVGSSMWSALISAPNVIAAEEQLLNEYAVDRETLSKDLSEFLKKLIAEGLLEYDEA